MRIKMSPLWGLGSDGFSLLPKLRPYGTKIKTQRNMNRKNQIKKESPVGHVRQLKALLKIGEQNYFFFFYRTYNI